MLGIIRNFHAHLVLGKIVCGYPYFSCVIIGRLGARAGIVCRYILSRI